MAESSASHEKKMHVAQQRNAGEVEKSPLDGALEAASRGYAVVQMLDVCVGRVALITRDERFCSA